MSEREGEGTHWQRDRDRAADATSAVVRDEHSPNELLLLPPTIHCDRSSVHTSATVSALGPYLLSDAYNLHTMLHFSLLSVRQQQQQTADYST